MSSTKAMGHRKFEGRLYKWTNYMSGWQPRWFVLYDDGLLHYYSRKEEVDGLSRGSINVSAAKISPSTKEKAQFRIVSGNDSQTLFLKAENETEKQRWIVLLGACKANFIRLPGMNGDSSQPIMGNALPEQTITLRKPRREVDEKLMELRTMRDILFKQVSDLRKHSGETNKYTCENCGSTGLVVVNSSDKRLAGEHRTALTVAENDANNAAASSMLLQDVTLFNASSEQFMRTVEECLDYFYTAASRRDSSRVGSGRHSSASVASMGGGDSRISAPRPLGGSHDSGAASKVPEDVEESSDVFYDAASDEEIPAEKPDEVAKADGVTEGQKARTEVPERVVDSFFSNASVKFQDIHVEPPENRIETKKFLTACEAIMPILDGLGKQITPVKSDIMGNIKKIEKGYETDPESFTYLQNLIASEIKAGTTAKKNSVTDALLWLSRAMGFIQKFLGCVCEDNSKTLVEAATGAYNETLAKFHPWIVKGIFNMAMRAVPARDKFFQSLVNDASLKAEGQVAIEEYVVKEMKLYSGGLQTLLSVIVQFYKENMLPE
eukprot:Nk52_evm14s62 gene=Nk52_evmTU14s62